MVCLANSSFSSHIVGGDMTYRCLGNNTYEIRLELFRDCLGGNPQALVNDAPASISIYNGSNLFLIDSNLNASFQIQVPANFSNDCVLNPPATCLNKIVFVKVVTLPPSNQPYTIMYQRCCRNDGINNISNPGGTGATYSCVIPTSANAICNNSSEFLNFPPQIICVNNPLIYNHSAFDLDGDSLSYEFCDAFEGGSDQNPKPSFLGFTIPLVQTVNYISPYNAINPMIGNPTIQINPMTGLVTGTPNLLGRYVVNVCCHEWRNGVIINTNKREFQFVVTDCSKAVVANIPQLSEEPNTYIISCKTKTVNFLNISTGGFEYRWDFGDKTTTNDTSSLLSPTYVYPDTGSYVVKLVVNPGSSCPDSIERIVKVYPDFNANATFNGKLCPDEPISFFDLSTATFNPINYWKWNFDDGSPFSFLQNPTHIFSNVGKTFNVTLISGSAFGCRDTATVPINIPAVNVFAGLDTTVVRDIIFNLNGTGALSYTWSPSTYLNNPFVSNPSANFPTPGLYPHEVTGITANGCVDKDTINITVANWPYLNLPNAFSPNGDGKNDIFKILNAGYSKLNYFRIFNRWGQEIFFSNNFRLGWDGTFKRRLCDLGTYFWVVGVVGPDGKEYKFKGDVNIIN